MSGLTQSVRVWSRTQTGTDPMGEPTYAWQSTDVDGVLVRPVNAPTMAQGDTASDVRPDAVRLKFSLAFPKGYAGPSLRHARVTLLDPAYGMDAGADGWRTALAVVGDPRPTKPCPTKWDMICEVVRTDG